MAEFHYTMCLGPSYKLDKQFTEENLKHICSILNEDFKNTYKVEPIAIYGLKFNVLADEEKIAKKDINFTYLADKKVLNTFLTAMYNAPTWKQGELDIITDVLRGMGAECIENEKPPKLVSEGSFGNPATKFTVFLNV